MYISVEQSMELDRAVKNCEVALRSYISDVLSEEYKNEDSFKKALQSISISDKLIYSKRFAAKLGKFSSNSKELYSLIVECKSSLVNSKYDNDVPYVSDLIDLLLIFFNAHFSDTSILKNFSSVEEFHYCCTLYHKTRNNLSHPASKPTTFLDANKVIYFIENTITSLDDKYFWYCTKERISQDITKYKHTSSTGNIKHHNLSAAASTHKSLLCRDNEIQSLYNCLLGDEIRQRLAGSVVLYGYGGVGKTAITTEFLYRLLRDKTDGKYLDLDYLLFFSSKDEYLRENHTTGELYIDSAKPEFSNLQELKNLICTSLKIGDIAEISTSLGRGIIAIDNIENIEQREKIKIIDFIKHLPRSVHFIVTSRNEEACEEKIHVEEFKNNSTGTKFVEQIIESEGFNVALNQPNINTILRVSKGNALIIVQVLNILDRGVSTFDEITSSLESMRSKNAEMIANFMYKNTFDNALKYLSEGGRPVNDIMQVISLYDERIELYSISKLSKIDISDAEHICNYLLERLILTKSGEYYELNEFAKRFVFIKLLPDRFELSKIKDRIKNHKERMRAKLAELDSTLENNSALHKNVNEWQPRNYIDKIVIAELFSLYGEAIKCVSKKDKVSFEKYVKELNDHSFITNHPYVPIQRARLLKQGMRAFYPGNKTVLSEIEYAYEQAIESVEYDYRYLIGTVAHASLFMLFGVFLCQQLNQHSRAIRFLEQAKKNISISDRKGWFITRNYLSASYEEKFNETKDQAYKDQLKKVVREVLSVSESTSRLTFDTARYSKRYSKWLE